MVVHDKVKIEQCLQMATWGEEDYILGIYYKMAVLTFSHFQNILFLHSFIKRPARSGLFLCWQTRGIFDNILLFMIKIERLTSCEKN